MVVNANEEEGELVGGNCDMLEINGRQPDDVQSSSLEREVGSEESTEAMKAKDGGVRLDTQSDDARSEPTLSALRSHPPGVRRKEVNMEAKD